MRWKKQKVTLAVLVNRIECVIEDIEAMEELLSSWVIHGNLKRIRMDLKDAIKGVRK